MDTSGGARAWGLGRCGPDIAGDSGLRNAPAGAAPGVGRDRHPPPHPVPRPFISLHRPLPFPSCDLSLASRHFQVLWDTLVRGARAPLAGGTGRGGRSKCKKGLVSVGGVAWCGPCESPCMPVGAAARSLREEADAPQAPTWRLLASFAHLPIPPT